MEALDSRQDVIIQKEVRAMFPDLTRKTKPALSMTSDELINVKLQMAADKEAKQKEKEVRKLARQTKAAENAKSRNLNKQNDSRRNGNQMPQKSTNYYKMFYCEKVHCYYLVT